MIHTGMKLLFWSESSAFLILVLRDFHGQFAFRKQGSIEYGDDRLHRGRGIDVYKRQVLL